MPYCPTCNGRFEQATFCPKDGTSLVADGEPVKSLVGQVIGRYRLTKLLGAGGMGEVYVGEHVSITKKVAVKLLHPEISTNREAVIRFEQEAKSASSIGHDNIVRIDDFDRLPDGRVYLCMEFLEGESLSEAMQIRGGLDPMRALVVMIQVCNGLGAAHSKGIIHRDMKPENVFLVRRSDGGEVAKILDFGIAKVKGTDNNDSLTKTGTVFGTPHYMSPEQALGQKLDHRADIYSVGVMLFEIFTGQVPFKAESFMGILSQHITKPAPRPSTTAGHTILKPIEDIILKAMSKEADQRFGSMAEMGSALKAVFDDQLRSGAPLPAGVGASVSAGLAQPTAMDSVARVPAAPDQQPTMASRPMPKVQPAAGYQATMASVSPQQAQMAPPYQPTMASVPGGAAAPGVAAAPSVAAAPGLAPSGTSEVIPKTMFATGSGQAAAAAGVPTPMPMPTPVTRPKKKSNTGLIIGIVAGVVLLLGGGAVAAVVFWDKIVGDDGGGTAVAKAGSGSGSGTAAAGTGSGSGSAATAKPDLTKVAVVEPKKDEPKKDEPKVEPKDEPKVEPKDEPKVEPKDEPKDEPKIEPKVIAKKKKKGDKKVVEAKVEAKVEPKVIAKKKVEAKVVEECCRIRVDSVPSDAAVIINGRPAGRTPWVKKFDRNERVSVTFAKGGYLDTAVSFTASENGTKKFKLKRRNLLGIPEGNPGAPGSDPFR